MQEHSNRALNKAGKAAQIVVHEWPPASIPPSRKAAWVESTDNTFQAIAREWFGLLLKPWALGHADKVIRRLVLNVFFWIGMRTIKAITAPELRAVDASLGCRGETAPKDAINECASWSAGNVQFTSAARVSAPYAGEGFFVGDGRGTGVGVFG